MKPLDYVPHPGSHGSEDPIITVSGLGKVYASGFQALKGIDLTIRRGEIFALLGPNGAGKTTLISTICGIVNPSTGTILADGHDVIREPRAARSVIGLVPQELATDAFETVWATVKFSRGLFGCKPDPAHLERVLRSLSLWDKRGAKIMTLSGGMKRRVMIAKALSHEPRILFLDEPTAGVDVELRRDMWALVRGLRDNGVTIILTTHYIEEAEEMADRIGVIRRGEIILVEDKAVLMRKLGRTPADAPASGTSRGDPAEPRGRARALGGRHGTGLHVRRARRAVGRREPAAAPRRGGDPLQGPPDQPELPRGHLRRSRERTPMNIHAIKAIYMFEMARTLRTLMQSIASPVLSTSLYFIVFGTAIGSRMAEVDGVSYGAFIVPGLIMLSILTESISNAAFGIYMPKFTGTIYELLSAPVSAFETVVGYVGAAATKSIVLGTIILVTARLFVDFSILHPLWMIAFLVLTSVTFCLFGFIIGIWADSFQKLQVVPLMIITPLAFLGGSFYSINMLPPVWQTIALFNPVVYLVSGFRWSFYGVSDVSVGLSLVMTLVFMLICLFTVWWIFRTGYRIKN